MAKWARLGSQNHNAKLTEAQVAQARRIAELRRALPTTRALARRFGISHDRLEDAVKGKTWKHVTRLVQGPKDALGQAFPEIKEAL